jgi:hypothetical protein
MQLRDRHGIRLSGVVLNPQIPSGQQITACRRGAAASVAGWPRKKFQYPGAGIVARTGHEPLFLLTRAFTTVAHASRPAAAIASRLMVTGDRPHSV